MRGHKKNSVLWAIIIVFLTTLITSLAQVFIKKGLTGFELTLPFILSDYSLITGWVLYALAAVLLIIALRLGELSVVYPVIASSFIWVTILAAIIFHDVIGPLKIAGITLIIIGISLIGLGGVRKR